MKQLLLILTLAFCSNMVFANNTEPVKTSSPQPIASDDVLADINLAPCYVCAACHGQPYCLVCDCTTEDCADKAVLLGSVLCGVSPDCCYVVGPGGPNND